MFAGYAHGAIRGYSVDTLCEVLTVDGHEKPPVHCIAVDSQGDVMFSSAMDGLKMWSLDTGFLCGC